MKEMQVAGWKDKRNVMHRYDLTAEMYEERYADEQKAKYRAALKDLNVADGAVLDAGCGSGLFFSNVEAKASMVVGVDISRKLLLKAKEQANVFCNVFILQADADHLPFRDKFFDTVFSFTILQNMPKPAETLNEFRRITKLGSRITVTGLKKVFSFNGFMEILESTGSKPVSFIDDENLNCYIAVIAV